MAITNTNFIQGRMNKSVDERLLPPGEYMDAMNVRLGATETTEMGAVENSRGNTQLTTLQFRGSNLSADATCIGAYDDGAEETMYWFVHDPNNPVVGKTVDMVVSYNTNTATLRYHVITLLTLNFDPEYLVTGVNKIEDLLFWTDDKNPPRRINVKSAYGEPTDPGNVDQTVPEDINVIVKPPGFEDSVGGSSPLPAPTIELVSVPGGENYIENKFVSFAYRYRYANNEYSATSLFTNPAFQPKPFNFSVREYSNTGMQNKFNAVNVTFSTGSKRVEEIDLLYKDSNTNSIYIIENFKKSDYGWSDDSTQNYTFTNSKIYSVLGNDELLRLYDNVPHVAKAQTLMGNRLMYGNYTDGFDITNINGQKIAVDFNTSLVSNYVAFLELPDPTLSNGTSYTIDPSNTIAATNSVINFDLTTVVDKLKKGASLTLDFEFEHMTLSGTTATQCYIDNADFKTANFELQIFITLDADYNSVIDFANSSQFSAAIGTILNTNFNPIATAADGTSLTDKFNAILVPPADGCVYTKVNSSITDATTQQGFLVSAAGNIISIQTIAMKYNSVTGPTDMYEYFRFGGGEAVFTTAADVSSLHSNRDYETGIVYLDEYARASGVLVSEYNTIFVPPANSTTQNRIKATIQSYAPSWAKKYKFVVKPSKGGYETIYCNFYYVRPSDNMCFFKLEGDNQNKVKVGDRLIVKTDVAGPLPNLVKTTVLGVSAEAVDFLTDANETGADTSQVAGLYMQIKVANFSIEIAENAVIDHGEYVYASRTRSSCTPQVSYPAVTWTCDTTGGGAATSPVVYDVPSGSIISIKVRIWRLERGRRCDGFDWEWDQTFTAQDDYDNLRDWWISDNINPGLASPGAKDGGEWSGIYDDTLYQSTSAFSGGCNQPAGRRAGNMSCTLCNASSCAIFAWIADDPADLTKPIYLGIKTNRKGCKNPNGRNVRISAEIVVNRASTMVVFETEPADANAELYYDASEALDITYDAGSGSGFHQAAGGADDQNQTSTLPAVVELPFMDCYTFSNGVESYKILDRLAAKAVVMGQRTLSASEEEAQEADRFADITYSGVYSSNAGINNLNEFNLGLANWKELENSFGEIQLLHARETDIMALQEDKVSYVLASKNLISDAVGGGTITSSPTILGTQIARIEEYGISYNPESFAAYGKNFFFTDTKRLAVIKLSGGGQNESLEIISDTGMRSWFRDQYITQQNTQKLGGYDPYMDEYVLGTNDISVPIPADVLECGVSITQASCAEDKSFTINVGSTIGDATLNYNISGGSAIINVTWNSIPTSSGSVTGSGSFTWSKTAQSPPTATVTVYPQGGATITYNIVPECIEEVSITVIKCVINSGSDSGDSIHAEYQWSDSTSISPTDSSSAQFGSNSAVFSLYESQTGIRSQGVFPYNGASLKMTSNKINYDNYDWAYPNDNFRFLSSNTLYQNNAADVSTLLGLANTIPDAMVTNPSAGQYTATVTPSTTPAFTLPIGNQYLYLIYDYRTISAAQLCFNSTSSGACCDCGWTCTAFDSSVQRASAASACQQTLTEVYYHNGSAALPAVYDLVYSNSDCGGNNVKTNVSFLPAGYYKISATQNMRVNMNGVVIEINTC